MNNKENIVDILFKIMVSIIAIPIGFMLGLISEAKKKKW